MLYLKSQYEIVLEIL